MRATIVVALIVSFVPSAAVARPRLEATLVARIAASGDFNNPRPSAINDRGDVVGTAVKGSGGFVGFLWTARDGFKEIASNALPSDINERGQVVGSWDSCDPGDEECQQFSGFVWSDGEGFRDLGTFVPFAINNRGDMAGYCDVSHTYYACVMRDAVVTTSDENAQLYGINERGSAVGANFGIPEGLVVQRDGTVLRLGPGTVATDINARGWVFGWDSSSELTATVWSRSGAATLPRGRSSQAFGVNAAGLVVGTYFDSQTER